MPHFKKANWVSLNAYPRWKAEVATPAFRQYLSNQIDLDELTTQLVDGWNSDQRLGTTGQSLGPASRPAGRATISTEERST